MSETSSGGYGAFFSRLSGAVIGGGAASVETAPTQTGAPVEAVNTAPEITGVVLPLLGESLCGQVSVSDPQTHGMVQKHVSYLVAGVVGDLKFESRKRFSDFEYLRKALLVTFPGLSLPQLPEKNSSRRFEIDFIEARRLGLEQFLHRLFQRPQLLLANHESSFLLRFLEAQEITKQMHDELETFKEDPEKKAAAFKASFSEELANFEKPKGDNGIRAFKGFLDKHISSLRENIKNCQELLTIERQQEKIGRTTFDSLSTMVKDEMEILKDLGVERCPRQHVLEAFRMQHQVAGICFRYERLVAVTQRELEDSEAMMEAIGEIGAMKIELQELQQKVRHHMEQSKKLAEGSPEMEKFKKDLQVVKDRHNCILDLYNACCTVFVNQEIKLFFQQKDLLLEWWRSEFQEAASRSAQQAYGIFSQAQQ